MPKKTIDQVEVASQRVLMRVDFNVPLDDQLTITDDRRIRACLPSIRSVLDRGGRLTLMSHLGRPKGNGFENRYSMRPVAQRLAELLGDVPVGVPDEDPAGPIAGEAVASLGDGEVLLLENLRFHPGERSRDRTFAGALAGFGDIYCNEAFGTCHRTDASMVGVPEAMGDRPKVAGLQLQKELAALGGVLSDPAHPFVAVVGGVKVSDKIGTIENLMNRVDTILVGGAMAYTFLAVLGQEMGRSMVERSMFDTAQKIIDAAAASPTDMILPTDHVCGKDLARGTQTEVSAGSIPGDMMGLDIGPDTMQQYAKELQGAGTIVWNGPLGAFEIPPFDVGTRQIARAAVRATEKGAVSIVGGGDTAAAVRKFELEEGFSHVSTGGGASLMMLEGKSLPGIEPLEDA